MKHTVGGILLAGGNDQRILGGADTAFLNAGTLPALARVLMAFEACRDVQCVVVVADAERADTVRAMANRYGGGKLVAVAPAFGARSACVASGLHALPPEVDLVVVHEVARPLVRSADLNAVIQIAARGKAGAATAFRVSGGIRTGPRKRPSKPVRAEGHLWLTASPQACSRNLLVKGLAKSRQTRAAMADETALMDLAGAEVQLVECDGVNLRVQCADDLSLAAHLLG